MKRLFAVLVSMTIAHATLAQSTHSKINASNNKLQSSSIPVNAANNQSGSTNSQKTGSQLPPCKPTDNKPGTTPVRCHPLKSAQG